MLKVTESPDKPAPIRNNDIRLASIKNDNSRLASKKNDDDSQVNRFGVYSNDVEYTRKSEKSKRQKSSKSQKLKIEKLAKLGKTLSKCGNSPNFNIIEAGLRFLNPVASTIFNRLCLAFTKALIF